MGLDYSINLYFRVEDIEKALLKTVDFAHLDPDRSPLQLRLPDGRLIDLPFTSHFKSDPIQLSTGGDVELDTSLLFPHSADIIEYYGQAPQPRETINGQVYLSVGYIYLRIRCGQEYAEFAYSAATSGMSRLFLSSRVIQTRFLELLEAADGVLGLIDIESFEYPLLESPAIRLTGEDVAWDDSPGKYQVDRFATAMKESRARLLSRWGHAGSAAIFHDKWVAPFNLDIHPWGFLDLPAADLQRMMGEFASRLGEATDDVLDALFAGPSRKYWYVACCFAAFARKENFVQVIGNLLLSQRAFTKPYIFALMEIGGAQAAGILDRFLLSRLEPSQVQPNTWRHVNLDWALAALIRLDKANNTKTADKYTGPGGLWEAFAVQGLEALLASGTYQNMLAEQPDSLARIRDEWFEQISLRSAERQLDLVDYNALKYFG